MTYIIRALAWLIPMAVLAIAYFQNFVDPRLLVLDPMVAADVSGDCCHTYYGIISNLGVFGWIAAATVSTFAAIVMWRFNLKSEFILFAAFAALFSFALGFDDAFLFHENIAPKFGIPQTGILAGYILFAGFYCLLGWRVIWRSDLFLFVSAGTFLALSMGLDVVLHSTDSNIVFAEDGAKFIGISCWLVYHFKTFVDLICLETAPVSVSSGIKRIRLARDPISSGLAA